MKYVVIATIVALWTLLAFLYRWSGKRGSPTYWVSGTAGFVWFALTLALASTQHVNPLSAPHAAGWAGFLGGLGIFVSMPLFMGAVARGNLAISWTILTLGFAAIALASLVYPGATLETSGIIGLAAATAAIVLLGWDSGKASGGGTRRGWGLFMTLAFLTNALAIYMMPVAEEWTKAAGGMDPPENKALYLATATFVFFAGNAVLCVARPAGERRLMAVGFGTLFGIIFFIANYLSFVALSDLKVPAYVLFPATNGGSTVTVALASAFFTRERPGTLGWVGLGLGLLALVLLGVSA